MKWADQGWLKKAIGCSDGAAAVAGVGGTY